MAHAHGASESCLRCSRPVGDTHADLCAECLGEIRKQGLSPADLRELYERQHERGTSSLTHSDTVPEPLLKHLAAAISKEALVLDIGSGGGHLGMRLAELGFGRVISSDHTSRAVSLMRQLGLERVVWLDAAHLPFSDASLECVVSIEVLEHLPDVEAHVREVARVLRRDGAYIIKTPNRLIAAPFYRLTGHHDIEIWHPSTLSAGELARVLRQSGLTATFLPLPLAGSQLRKLPGGPVVRGLATRLPWRAIPAMLRPSLVCVARKSA